MLFLSFQKHESNQISIKWDKYTKSSSWIKNTYLWFTKIFFLQLFICLSYRPPLRKTVFFPFQIRYNHFYMTVQIYSKLIKNTILILYTDFLCKHLVRTDNQEIFVHIKSIHTSKKYSFLIFHFYLPDINWQSSHIYNRNSQMVSIFVITPIIVHAP